MPRGRQGKDGEGEGKAVDGEMPLKVRKKGRGMTDLGRQLGLADDRDCGLAERDCRGRPEVTTKHIFHCFFSGMWRRMRPKRVSQLRMAN